MSYRRASAIGHAAAIFWTDWKSKGSPAVMAVDPGLSRMPRFANKPQKPAKIETTIHIQKLVHNSGRKYKAERAIKEIVKAGQSLMGTEVVKIDQELNSRIWFRSRANPPARVRVVFERKADSENSEKMITVASYKPVSSFKGLQTEKVE